MRHPFEAYVQLWERLSPYREHCNSETAASRLEAYFTSQSAQDDHDSDDNNDGRGGQTVIVLLDEIDYLVTKNQSVLYNFFDWPTRARHNKLVVIGVSNTVNLPDRLLSKVQSRIGSSRSIFKAYNAKEIEAILASKIGQASPRGCTVFDHDALVFVSKKTASMSGDIRKAFHICRSAAEMVLNQWAESSLQQQQQQQQQRPIKAPLVQIRHVVKVSRESFHSAQSQAISMCTPYEALVLVALASLGKTTGREFGGFDVEELLVKMQGMADAFGDSQYTPAPGLGELLPLLTRLAEAHLVSTQTSRTLSITYRASLAGMGGPWPLVSLTMDHVAVMLALRGTPHHGLAQKYLSL